MYLFVKFRIVNNMSIKRKLLRSQSISKNVICVCFKLKVFEINNCKTQKTAKFANGSKDSIDDNRRQTTFDDICIY